MLKKREPNTVTTMVVPRTQGPRETHIMIAGDFTRQGAKVTPGFPAVLPGFGAREEPP